MNIIFFVGYRRFESCITVVDLGLGHEGERKPVRCVLPQNRKLLETRAEYNLVMVNCHRQAGAGGRKQGRRPRAHPLLRSREQRRLHGLLKMRLLSPNLASMQPRHREKYSTRDLADLQMQ